MALVCMKFLFLLVVAGAFCKPLDGDGGISPLSPAEGVEGLRPRLWRRFVNPWLSVGEVADRSLASSKMRTKRNAEDCEKLELCKLHAHSSRSFFASFELYFVNKENARLWDHRSRTAADCERRYGGCHY